ncbi:MAG: transport secretion system VirB6 protein [Rhodoferax sp.]|nr:transport secretion system VirB6 protein [Rhodoferax sp.]
MATDSFFSTSWDGYSTALGVVDVVASGLSAAAGWLQIALSFYLMITMFLIVFGSMSWNTGVARLIRALLVIAVLTPAFFNRYVVQTFTTDIPNEIATIVAHSPTQSTVVEVFDELTAGLEAIQAQINSNSTWMDAPKTIPAGITMIIGEVALLLAFFIWFFAYGTISIVVCAGPFLIGFYLFDSTKQITLRWVSKLIGLMILILMVMITTQIIQVQERSYLRLVASTMTHIPPNVPSNLGPRTGFMEPEGMLIPSDIPSAAPTVRMNGNLDQQISILGNVVKSFILGLFLMLSLPSIAAYLGGGVAIGVAPIVMAGVRNVTRGR